MGVLDKVRELKERAEEKIDQLKSKAKTEYEVRREQPVREEAYQSKRKSLAESEEKYNRGEISSDLYEKRKKRYEERYQSEKIPVEQKVASGARKVGGRALESSKDWNPFGGLQVGREKRREAREKSGASFWNPAPRKPGGKSGGKPGGMMGVGFLFPPAPRKGKGRKKKRGGNGGSSGEQFGMGGTDGWLL